MGWFDNIFGVEPLSKEEATALLKPKDTRSDSDSMVLSSKAIEDAVLDLMHDRNLIPPSIMLSSDWSESIAEKHWKKLEQFAIEVDNLTSPRWKSAYRGWIKYSYDKIRRNNAALAKIRETDAAKNVNPLKGR